MMHIWAKWYVKVAVVVVVVVFGAFVSSLLANRWALHIFTNAIPPPIFGRYHETQTFVVLFTFAGGFVGLIIALVVVLFGYFCFRRFSKNLKKLWQWTRLRPMRVRSRRAAMVALAVVVAIGVFTAGAWMESRVSALEQKVVTGSTGRIVPFRLGSSSLESRVSELESDVSVLQRSTGTGRFDPRGSLESRVSALESKVGGSYGLRGPDVSSSLSSLARRVSALESKSGGSRFP